MIESTQVNQWFVRYDVPSVNGHVYRKGCFAEIPNEILIVSMDDYRVDHRVSLHDVIGSAKLEEREDGIVVTGVTLTSKPGDQFNPMFDAVGVCCNASVKDKVVQNDAVITGGMRCPGVEYSWWDQYPNGQERPLSRPAVPAGTSISSR